MDERRAGDAEPRPWNRGTRSCSCCSPTASATRAIATARASARSRVLDTIRAHRDADAIEILERVIELLDAHTGDAAAPRRSHDRTPPQLSAATETCRASRVASRGPAADPQEPRSAFSQRPAHSRAHRRRARADRRRRRSSRSARGGEVSPSCSCRAPAGSSLIEYDRALAGDAARALRDDVHRSSSSRRTCSTVDPRRGSRAGRYVSSATCRTTSRRRSSFTRSSAPRPERAVYLVQREVADRIVARAGIARSTARCR